MQEEMSDKYEQATAFLKLLANTNRLAVLCSLQDTRRNVTELAEMTGLPKSDVIFTVQDTDSEGECAEKIINAYISK